MKESEIDHDHLRVLAGDDRGFLKGLVVEFKDGSLVLLGEIKYALGKKDEATLARLLHQLKGSSGSLGLKSLFEMCRDLEGAEFELWEKQGEERLRELEVAIRDSSQLALDCLGA